MVNMVVCGLGKISRRVSQGCQYSKNMNLYGFISSQKRKAILYKEEFHATKAFTSFEEIYVDPHVDVVYLCTPNFAHYRQIKDLLTHHKSVICEKPMVLQIQELEELFHLAKKNHVFLMEAHKTAFNPLLKEVKQIIDAGTIGKVYHIEAEYSHRILNDDIDMDHWVFQESGGVSRDIGVYPVCFSHYMAQSELASHYTVKSNCVDFPCDFFFESLIKYKNGITANVRSSWLYDIDNKGCGTIYGTKGWIKIPAYWKGKEAYLSVGTQTKKITVHFKSDFTGEIEHAALCIAADKTESDIVSMNFSKRILEIIEN